MVARRKRLPDDLTGRRFGKLLVIKQAENVEHGRRSVPAWVCRCECGTEEILARPFLTDKKKGRDACTQCTYTRTCKQCGKAFFSTYVKTTCSDECRDAIKRQHQLNHYYRNREQLLEKSAARKAKSKARAEHDPAYAAHLRALQEAAEQRKREKRLNDPAALEAERARIRAWYKKNRQAVQAQRKQRFAALSPEKQEKLLEDRRGHYRKYANKLRRERNLNQFISLSVALDKKLKKKE